MNKEMISTNDFKTGQTIKLNNNLFQIIDFLHVKPGKGAAFIRCKLKNLRNESIINYTFNSDIKIELCFIQKDKMQFLYKENQEYFFINTKNYEQISINENKIKNNLKFISENIIIDIITYDKEILGINVPEKIDLIVVQTENTEQKDVKANIYKDGVLETGLIIKIPSFIEQGEKITINTKTCKYVSRSNK